jgi:hypothetical protein
VKYQYSQQRKDTNNNHQVKLTASLDTQPQLLLHSTSMESLDYQGGIQYYGENFIFQNPTQIQNFILNQIKASDLYNY